MLDESASLKSDKERFKNNAKHIYSHLMKCSYHNRINHSWIDTIFNCSSDIARIEANRLPVICRDSKVYDYVRKEAIKEYHKDGNPGGEIQFNIVINDFPNLIDVADIIRLRDYLMDRAKYLNDQSALEYISNRFK